MVKIQNCSEIIINYDIVLLDLVNLHVKKMTTVRNNKNGRINIKVAGKKLR